MRIRVVDDVDPRQWERLLEQDQAATFFHTLDWGRLIEGTIPGWQRVYVTAEHEGDLVAAIPAMKYSRSGTTMVGSMPFGTYGGVVLGERVPATAVPELVMGFFQMCNSPRVAAAELVDFRGHLLIPPLGGLKRFERNAHVLELATDYDGIHKSFKPSNRNKIRKAERAGVVVRRGKTTADFLKYRDVFNHCCKRWKRRPFLRQTFFVRLSELDPEHVRLWLAEYRDRVIAGLLNFRLNGSVQNWGSVSFSSTWDVAPNNLLHARAIQDAVHMGCRCYNFGENPGLPGVDDFKKTFGTRQRSYNSFRWERTWYRALRRVSHMVQQRSVSR
jgi:predicted N-acyltransferase